MSQRASANEVRLIGGQWKRSKLQVLDKPGLRPTPNRVRETLFNWLGQDLSGWRCVDVFAGSGALGFEAASRGALQVVLVERDTALVRCLRDSQSRLKAASVQVEAGDGLAYLQRRAKGSVDLVFLDPPFDANVFDTAVAAAAQVLADGGWAYLEADRAFTEAALQGVGWRLHRSGRSGAVFFHLLQRMPAAGNQEASSH
ncbi:MAG: 16S rRNA (guanine(966)-N(2))-methyltransferase RsmD [Burkholderiaceae bacterium]